EYALAVGTKVRTKLGPNLFYGAANQRRAIYRRTLHELQVGWVGEPVSEVTASNYRYGGRKIVDDPLHELEVQRLTLGGLTPLRHVEVGAHAARSFPTVTRALEQGPAAHSYPAR